MKYYTVKEVAKLYRVNPYTVRRWGKEKKLSSDRLGWKILIPENSLGAPKKVIENLQTPVSDGTVPQTPNVDNYNSNLSSAEPSDTSPMD